jgi:type II secretory pathway pseudopilin PulG
VKIRQIILFIAGFLSALLLTAYLWFPCLRERTREKATTASLLVVAEASRSYFTNCGTWPQTISELTTTNNPKHSLFLWLPGPYPLDGSGRPLTYVPYDSNTGSGAVQSRKRIPGGAEIIYEVRFGCPPTD